VERNGVDRQADELRLVRFNVPLDIGLYAMSGTTFLQVWWPNQQYQSTERGSLVNQVALNLNWLTSPCYN